jgi:ABC-type transport system involved in multi-copper enzyme maturation permease subunit
MIQMKQVMAIARAETRITRRLARYWIFLGISYFIVLFIYLICSFIHGFFSSSSAAVGIFAPRFLVESLGASYLFFYIVGTIFLAFDVRARDMRERMNEVLDSRPYTNLELVLGRFFGILLPSWIPMLILAVLLELLGILLVAMDSPIGEPIGIGSLLTFVFPMALPALAFTLSLTFLVTLLVRNRLVAAVILLALLVFYFFWFSQNIPIAYSTLFGLNRMGSLKFPSEIIPVMTDLSGWMQRLAVLLTAFGLLGFSASVHPRHDGGSRSKLGIYGTGLIILGCIIIGFGLYRNTEDIKIAQTWRKAHAASADMPVSDLQSITGEVKIDPGKALNLDLDLTFRAPNQTPLKKALFTLNPGQEVKEALDASGHPLAFTHENGLLELALPSPLNPGEETRIHLSIKGLPDHRFAHLESAIKLETIKSADAIISLFGFETAIFDRRFVALMPGIRWLPVAGAEKGRDDPRTRAVDFFDVDLFVDLPNGWLVAGPGQRHKVQEETDVARFRFSPPAPVPEVALIASRFESRSVEIEGVLMELLIHQKHMKNLEVMSDTIEKIRTWIGERLREAKAYGLSYPYDSLTLVEVPPSLRSYGGGWRMDTAMAPPGLLLMRETSLPTARFDTIFRKPEAFKDREGGIAQAKLDKLQGFFINDLSGGNVFMGAARNFFVHQTAARGPEALALNFVMETLSTLLVTETKGYFSVHLFKDGDQLGQNFASTIMSYVGNLSMGDSFIDAVINSSTSRLEVWDQVLGVSLKDMDPREDPARTVDVLTLKANAIAQSLLDVLGPEKTGQLLSSLRDAHQGRSFTFDDVLAAGKAMGQDLEELFGDWLGSTTLPGFVCADAQAYRLPDSADGSPRYQLLFSVRNDEPVPGLFRFVFLFAREGGAVALSSNSGINVSNNNWNNVKSEPIRLAGKSAVRFGTVLSRLPISAHLAPYLSLNRARFAIQLPPVDQEKIKKTDAFEGLEQIPWALPEEPFIIVDDLDAEFQVVEGDQSKGLRIKAKKRIKETFDEGLPAQANNFFDIPKKWSRIIVPKSWGKYRHTLAAVNAGNGEKKAVFTATIPHAGPWDLELHIPAKQSVFPGRKWGTWNMIIKDSNGDPHEIKFDSNAAAQGWNLVDSLDLPEGEISLTLSNKTDGRFVLADAIRWSPSAG